MKFTINKRAILIWAAVIAMAVVFYLWMWPELQNRFFAPPPPPKTASTPAAKAPAAPGGKIGAKHERMATDSVAPAQPAQGLAYLTAGNVGELTKLRAQLDEMRIQAQIAELKAKMAKPTVSAPVVAKLPDLPLPPVAQPLPAMKLPAIAVKPAPAPGVAVVSVQGIDGDISATIRAGSSGTVTVRKGSRFSGGIVTDITHQAVTVTRNGKSATLPFE